MLMEILTTQAAAEATTIITFILTLGLAIIITKRYLKKRSASLLFWSLGIWLFTTGVLLEIIFAFGAYSAILMNAYLLVVALIVEVLALGSMQLIKSIRIKRAYYAFAILSTMLLIYSLSVTNPGNLITEYVVGGIPSNFVLLTSSIITFPAAIILAVVAYKGYRKTHDRRMLSIIAGVVIVSIAGTLYIIQYPAFLYIAEFAGILLLWYGFF